MGVAAFVGKRWQRRGLRLIVLIWGLRLALLVGGLTLRWYWMARPAQGDIDPSLTASTQVEVDSSVWHPDFRGEWKLDLEVSDSIAPILRTVGKSEWTILLASKVAVTHIIRGDLHRLTLLVKTPMLDQKQEMLLDGTPTWATGPNGSKSLATTCWSKDGQSLVTTTQPSTSQPMSFRIARSLASDRRTMFLDLECHGMEGKPIRVRRVFRLVALPSVRPATPAP